MFDPSTKMKCRSLALLKTSVPDDPKAFLAFGHLHTQTIKNKSKSFQLQAFTVQAFSNTWSWGYRANTRTHTDLKCNKHFEPYFKSKTQHLRCQNLPTALDIQMEQELVQVA